MKTRFTKTPKAATLSVVTPEQGGEGPPPSYKVTWCRPVESIEDFEETFATKGEARAFARGLCAAEMYLPEESVKVRKV